MAREIDLYSRDFESVRRDGKKEPSWFQAYRVAGMESFLQQGFPSRRDEEWRFSNFRSLSRTDFLPSVDESLPCSAEDFSSLPFSELACPRLVLVNGTLRPDLCSCPEVPGMKVTMLQAALRDSPEVLEAHLGQHAEINQNPFVALNAALCREGFVVHVNPDTVLSSALHVLHITTDSIRPVRTHLRNLVVVGANSVLTLVESYLGTGDNVAFTNPVTEVVVGKNSTVRHYRLQNESRNGFHVSCNAVHQSGGSNYRVLSIDLGNLLTRNDFRCVLDGEGGLAGIDGLYLLKRKQHLDNYTTLEHAKPHCDSRVFWMNKLGESFVAESLFTKRPRGQIQNKPTIIYCCPMIHLSTRNPSWRSMPMTSSARMVQPLDSLIRKPCSIFAREGFRRKRRGVSLSMDLPGK